MRLCLFTVDTVSCPREVRLLSRERKESQITCIVDHQGMSCHINDAWIEYVSVKYCQSSVFSIVVDEFVQEYDVINNVE